MLRPMGMEVLKYCYAVDLPCSNFQIFWPIKKVAQKSHLGAVCDWFRWQFYGILRDKRACFSNSVVRGFQWLWYRSPVTNVRLVYI